MLGKESLYTTSASDNERLLNASRRDGIRRLARAVIWLAIHDLGTWCRRCACRGQTCQCRQKREDAIRFLRAEEPFEVISTLEYWAMLADWPHQPISAFFSRENRATWIPFVIKMRSPYRRARRGASAPFEASFGDLLVAYSEGRSIVLPMEHPPFVLT